MPTATPTKPTARVRRGRSVLPDGFLPSPFPKFVGSWPRLAGRQEPEVTSWFPGDESDGDAAAELGFEAGARCMPWQWWALRKILSRLPSGLWTHPDCVWTTTRQSGKTQVVILRILFGLFILGETIIYSAQRWKTSEDVFDRCVGIILANEWMAELLEARPGCPDGHSKAGKVGQIFLANGGSLFAGLRSGDLGRGSTKIDLVIFDESYKLTEDQAAAMTGAQLASENAQTIYISTPAIQSVHPYCQQLATMRSLGLKRAPDVFFAEWRAPDGMGRADPEAWRLASPSFGVIQKARDVSRQFAKSRTDAGKALFDADYLGIGDYPADDDEREPVIPVEEVWRPLTDQDPVLVGQRVIAISRVQKTAQDVGTWFIAAGSRTATGRVQLEVGFAETAHIGQVALYVNLLVERWDPAVVVVEGHDPARALAPYLKSTLDLDVHVTTAPQWAVACRGFIDSAFSGDISHSDQPVLSDALGEAALRKLPQGDLVWDGHVGSPAPLVAVTLAHWAVLEFAGEDGPTARPVGAAENLVATSSDFDVIGAAF